MKNDLIIVKTTFSKMAEAKKLAKILLNQKLAACIQFSKIESMFIWEGKISSEAEILVSIKTESKLYKEIEKLILQHHSYEIPQIIAIKIAKTSQNYQKWINLALNSQKK